MPVTEKKKKLYHIQNMNICSDGTPYDLFVWCDHFPNKEDLKKAIESDLDDVTENEIDEFQTSSGVYEVYAEEL